MKISVRKGLLEHSKASALCVFIAEGQKRLAGAAGRIDRACGGILGSVLEEGDFQGRVGQSMVLYTGGCLPAKRIILAGLGKTKNPDAETPRAAMAAAARRANEMSITALAVAIDRQVKGLSPEDLAEAVVEGVSLGSYSYDAFKSNGDGNGKKKLRELEIYAEEPADLKRVSESVRSARIACASVLLARDLCCAPSCVVTPDFLAREAMKIAGPRLKVKALTPGQMKKEGMGAILGVARGSHEPASFIVMEYTGGKKDGETVVLAGKAITFDSGGISLKPADKMHEMKSDMSGGAAVIAVMKAIAALRLPVNLVGLVPASENLPGGGAYKPGDILRSLSGLTIEVISTDAEGRLLLADALSYAARYKPAALVDMATLTGACQVALGDSVCGMFGTDEKLKDMVKEASARSGELLWELPLVEEYNELIKSDVADLKNTGGRAGGAITAALFLKRFTGDFPWVHLDIAGPAWSSAEKGYLPKGGTGFGVRLLLNFLEIWAGRK